MKAIVVVDQNWGIGRDGKLLIHLPGDLKYFKEKTLGKVLVIGRETLQSLPGGKPLPGRQTIVLSRDAQFEASCKKCTSMGDLFKELEGCDMNEVFIAGGASVYKQFLPYCDTYYVTKIFSELDADCFFPNLDKLKGLKVVWESDLMEESGVKYQFIEYRKK